MEKEIKINRKNLIGKKAGLSYLQILILVLSSFAFSFIVYESSKEIEKIYQEKKQEIEKLEQVRKEAKANLLVSFVSSWFKRSKISLVSAQESGSIPYTYEEMGGFSAQDITNAKLQCCPELKTGTNASVSCQDIANFQCQDLCAVPCLPTKCELTSSCKLGCCYDTKEGLCGFNVPKKDCEERGKWYNDAACNINECKLGCCVLGSETQFVTEKRCEKLSNFYSMNLDFKANIITELECLALSYSVEKGACVIQAENDDGEIERGCKFVSKEECLKLGGLENFYVNKLCTNTELNTTCQKTKETTCVEGRDGVYFLDSCGNPGNIYDSSKIENEEYWNKIIPLTESCKANPNSKTCGNCDYFLGSRCGEGKADYGKYVCKNLNCGNRRNGESWCEYESYIGEGKDVPGSRHYKFYCLDGQVKSEPCGDFRTGLCVESDVGSISMAACRPNRAMECLSYNAQVKDQTNPAELETLKKKCQENVDCEIRNLDFGRKYQFSVCTAKYPPGFDLKAEGGAEVSQQICNQADFKCVKIMTKKLSGWKCIAGCECDTIEFTQQMNDWCVSLGDCGAYVNVAGQVTEDGYSVSNAPKIDASQYEKYSQAKSGQKAEPGDFSELMKAKYGWGASTGPSSYKEKDYTMMFGLGSTGGLLLGMLAAGYTAPGATLTPTLGLLEGGIAAGGGAEGMAGVVGSQLSTALAPYISGFSTALSAVAIGAAVGLIVAKIFGLKGEAVLVVAITGVVVGLAVGIWAAIIGKSLLTFCLMPPIGTIVCIVGILIIILSALIMKFMKIGKVKKTVVNFNCDVWQPPRGGDDCEKCNEKDEKMKELKPCTKYKCSSLGQTCDLLNEGTGKELCIDNSPHDVSASKISPWKEVLTQGYKYTDVSGKGFKIIKEDNECLTEFTPVIFGIKTDKPSQCRMDVEPGNDYEKMQFYFGDSNLYKYNHLMALNMPSVESLLQNMSDELPEQGMEEEIEKMKTLALKKLGDFNLYVRCINKNGNYNIAPYTIKTCIKPGPDLTSPYIVASEPATGSHLNFNQNSSDLKIYINEPANCKYSKIDMPYDSMSNIMNCLVEYEDAELYGWPCSSRIENLSLGSNKFYFKCKDQPWLEEENKSRNVMQESFMLELIKSLSELKITSITPEGSLSFGIEPASVKLEVKTSGGAENGKSECSYSFTNSSYIQMFNTFSSSHSQEFNQMLRGTYTVNIKCQDIAGNKAEGKTEFEVKIDNEFPLIMRAYKYGDSLKVITNEKATCYYTNSTCKFSFENSSEMTSSDNINHYAGWLVNENYYIKCKDLWENKPDDCSIIIKAEGIE